MRTLLELVGLFTLSMLCWAQGAIKAASNQIKCDPHKMNVDLRDKNSHVLRGIENQWIQAYGERDGHVLACILADDFEIGSMPDEKLEINNKQHVMDWMGTKSPSVNKVEHLDIEDYKGAAVVRGIYSVRTPDGKLASRFQFTDVFVYRADGWQAVSREIAQLTVH